MHADCRYYLWNCDALTFIAVDNRHGCISHQGANSHLKTSVSKYSTLNIITMMTVTLLTLGPRGRSSSESVSACRRSRGTGGGRRGGRPPRVSAGRLQYNHCSDHRWSGHQFDDIWSVPLAIWYPLHRRGEQVLDFCWVLADKLLFESFRSCCQICPNVFVHPFY